MIDHLSSITRYSLYTLLIFTPLARGSVQPWAITVIHMITLIALTAFLMERSIKWDWKWIKTPLDKPFIALLIICLVSSIFSLHKYTSFWSMVLLVNYLIIFYLIIHTVRTRSQLRRLVYLIIGIAVFLSVFGLFKLIGNNPFPWWEYPEIALKTSRLSATYGNPDHLAGYMEMALPLVLGLFVFGYNRGIISILLYISFLLLAALVLSLSRGSWLGIIIGLVFMALCLLFDRHFKSKRIVIGIICSILALAFIVISSTSVVERIVTLTQKDPETNLSSRILGWKGTIKMIKDHPLIGTGPGTYSTLFTQYQPPGLLNRRYMAHNDYLHFISETGLTLMAIVVWMLIVFYRKGFRRLKNPSRLVRGITLGAMSGTTAILVHSLGDFNLHIPANAILFTVLAAITASPIPKNT